MEKINFKVTYDVDMKWWDEWLEEEYYRAKSAGGGLVDERDIALLVYDDIVDSLEDGNLILRRDMDDSGIEAIAKQLAKKAITLYGKDEDDIEA